jgi:hypothetical protein
VKRAAWLLAIAAVVVAAGGWALAATWHLSVGTGIYCSVGTASTVGCNPSLSPAGQVTAVVVMLAAIPILAACFALVTGHHAGKRAGEKAGEHLAAAEKRIAREADARHEAMQRHMERLLAGHCADIKQHVSTVADAQVSAGAGSNPAAAGLDADQPQADPAGAPEAPAGERVVPPAATSDPLPLIKLEPKTAGSRGRRQPKGGT